MSGAPLVVAQGDAASEMKNTRLGHLRHRVKYKLNNSQKVHQNILVIVHFHLDNQ